MGWADELTAAAATAAKPQGWASQLAQDAQSAQPPMAPSAPEKSWWEKNIGGGELGRQVGLTVRHGITGITGLPAMVGDALNKGINLGIEGVNSAAGTHIPTLQMPTEIIQRAEDQALPKPANKLERIVGDATSAMAGTGPTMAAGNLLLKSSSPVANAVGATLRAAPANQVVASGTAGASGGAAREEGLGPGWQLAAALAGGTAGALGSAGLGSAVKAAGARLAPKSTEWVAPGSTPTLATPAQAGPAVDSILADSVGTPSAQQTADLTDRTAALLNQAPTANPAAAARAADFRQLGIQPTLGQITRDQALYAQEHNLRGLSGVGDPLLQRFASQNEQLANLLRSTTGDAAEPYQAGQKLAEALKSFDDNMRTQVSDAYKAARQSSGAQLDVPLQGVAQDYADVLHNFGDKVPSGVRNNFEGLGLMTGNQKKIFSVDDAENLLKVINANRSSDPATNKALDTLSASVKQAVLSADDQGGVFAQPRQLAAQRFALHEALPALKAASEGSVAPDDFVRKFVVNGKTDNLKAMADVLQQADPQALQMAKSQLGASLKKAAFGANPAGDKVFAPDRYAQALQSMGTEKLGALFSPDEVDQLQAVGRVGSYINSQPAYSPVNHSNTGAVLLDHAKDVPVVGKFIDTAAKRAFVARSLKADLADTAINRQPDQLAKSLAVSLTNGSKQGQQSQ